MAIENRWRKFARALVSLFACAILTPSACLMAQGNSTEVDSAFARATQLHEAGDLEGAIRAYQAILASHPQRADVRSNLGAAGRR